MHPTTTSVGTDSTPSLTFSVMTKKPYSRGIRAVALVEAAKAGLVLLAGCGLLALLHRDFQELAEQWILRFHLDPARRFPRIFMDAASQLTDARLWYLASLALAYAVFRLVEAYGLWHERRWAEWVALATGAIYIPFEVSALVRSITGIKISALIINIVIVAYLGYVLRHPPDRLRSAK